MQTEDQIRLTQFASGAGCGCKIAPQVLATILAGSGTQGQFASLLVGHEHADDAAVYLLHADQCIISTADFFTPIVDDAYTFGQVAAANALSDVYAMGGAPLMAIALLGWPVEKLNPELASRVIMGARDLCSQAGIPLAGGHSISSPEPIFGLSVTGSVHPQRLKKNQGALPGDFLFLTKPLGTGILATAGKRDQLLPAEHEALVQQLVQINSVGQHLGAIAGVRAMTDVTGFGLAGHLLEMLGHAGHCAEIYYHKLSFLPGAISWLGKKMIPDATYRNWNGYGKEIGFGPGVPVMEAFSTLPDPQTNGGLLLAVAPEAVEEATECLRKHGYEAFAEPIGRVTAQSDKRILVQA